MSLGDASSPSDLTAVGNVLYFAAYDPVQTGNELWKSDGTAAGTMMVADINPNSTTQTYGGHTYTYPAGSSPTSLTAMGDELFFLADDGVHGREGLEE